MMESFPIFGSVVKLMTVYNTLISFTWSLVNLSSYYLCTFILLVSFLPFHILDYLVLTLVYLFPMIWTVL